MTATSLRRSALVLGVAIVVASAAAADQSVTAGGATNRFNPQVVYALSGENITWTNIGGTHNVTADDNSFRCANGCDDTGGDGTPAAGWQFTRSFSGPAYIPYHCQVHGAMGMVGAIRVLAGVFNDGFESGDTTAWSLTQN